jgi:hypothetical protein
MHIKSSKGAREAMTDIQARAKVLDLLDVMQMSSTAVNRWLQRINAEELESLILDMMAVLQRKDSA